MPSGDSVGAADDASGTMRAQARCGNRFRQEPQDGGAFAALPWPPAGRIFQRSPALFSRKKENQNNALTKKTGSPVRFPFAGFSSLPFCRKGKPGRKRASLPPAKGRRQERGPGPGRGRRCTPWPWPPAGRIFQRSPALFSRKKKNQDNTLTKKTGSPVRFPFAGFSSLPFCRKMGSPVRFPFAGFPLLPFCRKEKAGRKRAFFPPGKGRRQERGKWDREGGVPLRAMAVAASWTHFPTIPRPFLPEKGKSEQCPDKKDGFARSLSLRRLFFASVLPKRKARAEARILSSRQGPPTRTGGGIGKGACPFAFPSSAFPCFRFVEKKRPGGSALSFSPEKKP